MSLNLKKLQKNILENFMINNKGGRPAKYPKEIRKEKYAEMARLRYKNLSKEDLLKQLKNKTAVSCKDVTFRFLGLSLATFNTVISVLLSGIMLKVIKNYGQNK